jgi:hypothetical protein
MNEGNDKFDQALADQVEHEERVDWFERSMHRRRHAMHESEAVGNPGFYRIANAAMILLIALGLYLLGQFDGIRAERQRIGTKPQPDAFDDLVIRLPKEVRP